MADSESDDSASSDDSQIEVVDLLKALITAHLELQDELYDPWRNFRSASPIPRFPQLALLHWAHDNNSKMFRRKVRVGPATFDAIVKCIENHPIFQNNSNNPQTAISTQLAVTLNRFGHYGNAATLTDIGEWAGISAGTVETCTKRVAVALMALHDFAVHLPNDEEKQAAKAFSAEKVCPEWGDGYLSADGSTVVLFEKPGYFGEAYFDRSSNYSINMQVRRFKYLSTFVIKVNLSGHIATAQSTHRRLYCRTRW
jgi:hypothetical protein